ncbi:MAG: hypothetical protein QNJ17_06680 [Desulfocapsaceae bacterium]|nr:hypothetical protein [Desulfocapsaceae bacterium]
MQITKSFISRYNTASITCPKCRKSRNINVEKYRYRRHTIKVRCSCHHHFAVLLDFRKHFRKETNLDGAFVMVPPGVGSGKLNVLNISKIGIGFTIGFAVDGVHTIVPGQKVRVTFQLDNKKQSIINKTVTIRTVNDTYIGGEFDLNEAFEKDLGFYLRF